MFPLDLLTIPEASAIIGVGHISLGAYPMRTKLFAEALATTLESLRNVERFKVCRSNAWAEIHREALARLEAKLPSGSGWDSGTTFDREKSNSHQLIFSGDFHHMNEHGSYDGWTSHIIRVRPTFTGMDVTVSGSRRNDIKEHLAELFYTVMNETVDVDELYKNA
jgi:hypothetical protein